MRNVSRVLDNARWMAALLVAASHARNFLFVDWPQVLDRGPIAAAFYWLTGFGRISVVVFFVLSGYLVGGRVFAGIAAGTFSLQEYALSRFARLYPPLLAALLLCALFDQIGMRLANAFGYYDFPNSYGVAGATHAVAEAAGPLTAIVNLLFMQTIAGRTFGSNSPLWSLANEFWYYAFIPVIALLLRGAARRRGRLAAAAAVGALAAAWLPSEMLILATTWLAGAAAYRFSRPLAMTKRFALLAAFFFAAGAVRTLHPFPACPLGEDLVVGAAFAALLWSLGRPAVRSDASHGLSGRLAGFSYTLYLVHVPLLFLLAASTLQHFATAARLQPGPASTALFAAGLALAVALAYGVAQVTEVRTDDVRRRIRAWLRKGADESAA
jgi:peptidoglycan/LPS O-acetylase OafA/YrhL